MPTAAEIVAKVRSQRSAPRMASNATAADIVARVKAKRQAPAPAFDPSVNQLPANYPPKVMPFQAESNVLEDIGQNRAMLDLAKGIEQTIPNMALRSAGAVEPVNYPKDFKQNPVEQIASGLVGMAADPVTYLSFGLGGAVGKVAGKELAEAGARRFLQKAGEAAVTQGLGLGGLEAAKYPVQVASEGGVYSPREHITKTLAQGLTGAAAGVAGTAGGVLGRAGTAAGEAAAFSLAPPALEGRAPTEQDFIMAAGTILGMHVAHGAIKLAGSGLAKLAKGEHPTAKEYEILQEVQPEERAAILNEVNNVQPEATAGTQQPVAFGEEIKRGEVPQAIQPPEIATEPPESAVETARPINEPSAPVIAPQPAESPLDVLNRHHAPEKAKPKAKTVPVEPTGVTPSPVGNIPSPTEPVASTPRPVAPEASKAPANAPKASIDRDISKIISNNELPDNPSKEGETVTRVVWNAKAGDELPTNDLERIGVAGKSGDVRGIHTTSDPDYWINQLEQDYSRDSDKARVITIRVSRGESTIKDPQYKGATTDEYGNVSSGHSEILLTKRKSLIYGKDWKFADEQWPEEARNQGVREDRTRIFNASGVGRRYNALMSEFGKLSGKEEDSWWEKHNQELEALINIRTDYIDSDKPVPPEVLADYPDLAAKYGKRTDVTDQTVLMNAGLRPEDVFNALHPEVQDALKSLYLKAQASGEDFVKSFKRELGAHKAWATPQNIKDLKDAIAKSAPEEPKVVAPERAEEPSTPPTPKNEAVGTSSIRKSTTDQWLKDTGRDPINPQEVRGFKQREPEVRKILPDIEKIVERKIKSGENLTSEEVDAAQIALADKRRAYESAFKAGDESKADRILGEIESFTRNVRDRTSEVGRTLQAVSNEAQYDLASINLRAQQKAGRSLSKAEKQRNADLSDRLSKVESEIEELRKTESARQEEIAKKEADAILKREQGFQRRKGKIAETREAKLAKLAELNKQFAAKLHRFNDVTSVPEAMSDLVKIVKVHIELGAVDLADLINRVTHDHPSVSPFEIYRALQTKSASTRSAVEAALVRRRNAIKRESRLLMQLNETQAAEYNINGILGQLKQLRKEVLGGQYDGETATRILKLIDEARSKVERAVGNRKAKVKSPEDLAAVNTALRALWKAANSSESLEGYETQLRTGDYTLTLPPKPSPISDALWRKNQQGEAIKAEIDQSIEGARKKGKIEKLSEIYNLTRSTLTAGDMGGALWNGKQFILSHPVEGMRAFGNGLKAYFSSNQAAESASRLHNRSGYERGARAGLELTKVGSSDFKAREEMYRSTLAEKLPIVGWLVRAGERNYVTSMNEIRARWFDNIADILGESATSEELQALARMVNAFTKRGEWGKDFSANTLGRVVNNTFFAPRRALSVVEAPYLLAKYRNLPRVRNAIAKDVGKAAAVTASLMTLSYMMGGQAESNPNSGDFGKIRFGNQVYDFMSGELSYLRLMLRLFFKARIWKQSHKDTGGVDWTAILKDTHLDSKHEFANQTTAPEMVYQFLWNKLHPSVRGGAEAIFGQDAYGRKVSLGESARNAALLIFLQDAYDAYEADGVPKAIGVGAYSFIGGGVQTYEPKKRSGSMRLPSLKPPDAADFVPPDQRNYGDTQ